MCGYLLLVVYVNPECLYHYVNMMEDTISHSPFYPLPSERKEKQKVNERGRERERDCSVCKTYSMANVDHRKVYQIWLHI